jgi:hypothetical protein
VSPRAGLDIEDRGKILFPPPGIESRSPGRPARSQTLYCLSYPAPRITNIVVYFNLYVSIQQAERQTTLHGMTVSIPGI